MALPRSATEHRDDLQGLRAVAVLLVVLGHAGVSFLKGGYVGVDVFFVLSGFLITTLLLSQAVRRGSVSFSEFYGRRAKRILPAATLTLVAVDLFAYHFLNFVRAKQVMVDSRWASIFAANVHYAQEGTNYFAQNQPASPLQHFWSLAVEEQFYVVWPALLSLVLFGALTRHSARHAGEVRRRALVRLLAVIVLLGAASLAWSVTYTHGHPTASYFSTFSRAWELALGAGLALVVALRSSPPATRPARWPHARAAIGWVGLLMIAVAAVDYSGSTAFPGSAALLPTLGAALVIGAGLVRGESRYAPARVLSVAPLRYVGDRSYAYYLWHWPVLTLAVLYTGHRFSTGANLLLLLGAFALSVVSYRLVENPLHRARWPVLRSAALWPVSLVAVLLLAGFGINAMNSRAASSEVASETPILQSELAANTAAQAKPGAASAGVATVGHALSPVAAAVRAAEHGARLPVALNPPVANLLNSTYNWPAACGANDGQTRSEICHFGKTTSPRTIVLFGDSHAEMWMPAILATANADGWDVIPLSKSACTPQKWLDGRNWAECHKWYVWAVREARSLHPDVLLVSGCCGAFGLDLAETVKHSYLTLAASLKHFAKHVVFIGDNVGVGEQPVDCLLQRHATMSTCTSVWPDDRFYLNEDLSTLTKRRGFGFIDTNGWFCADDHCPMVVGNTIVYIDTGHITEQYAQSLAGPFRVAFEAAIRSKKT